MNYKLRRPDFRNGDIIFFAGGEKTWVRRLISWFTGRHYHVGIAFWGTIVDTEPRLLIAEALPSGFRIVNLGFYKDRDMVVFRCPNPATWSQIADTVLDSTGVVPYDFLDLTLVGMHERFGTPIPRRVTGKGEICSVIVSKILQNVGVRGIGTMVSPQRLLEQLSKRRDPAFTIEA